MFHKWSLQALAAILGRPLKVDKIRAGRDKPGAFPKAQSKPGCRHLQLAGAILPSL